MIRARDFVAQYLRMGMNADTKNGRPGEEPGLVSVYCSDLRRAIRSAEIIAAPHGLQPIQVPDLRERDFGMWEGMTFAGIKEAYPREFGAWMANPLEYCPTRGENTMDVSRRVAAAVEEIVHRHPGKNIAVVAHGGVNRIVLCRVMGIPLDNLFTIEQDYGAVNIIEFRDGYPVVKLMNGCAHG